MRLIKLALVCAIAGLLAACGTPRVASVSGGEDHALKAPEFAVKGATDFDQRWIDETTEAGIAALGWKRPAPRPAEWDKPLSRDVTRSAATAEAPSSPVPPPKKKRLRDRIRDKWRKLRHEQPVEGG